MADRLTQSEKKTAFNPRKPGQFAGDFNISRMILTSVNSDISEDDNAANFIQTVVEMEKEYSKSSDILELMEKNVKFLSSENNDLIKSIYDLSDEKTQISIKINGYESKGARNEGVEEKD